MARRNRSTNLPAPFLRRLTLREEVMEDAAEAGNGYPFDQAWLKGGAFALDFTTPVTILIGENGCGKSTLIEAIAALCGYDEAGGGKGYRPVDHSRAVDSSGADLAEAFRASWLPKITEGWFFRAESFYSVSRYLDEAAIEAHAPPPDFLSHSHGEGFLRFFAERCTRTGLYFMDEPESALSPMRQLELLRLLNRMSEAASAQAIIATHSPLLMALPGVRLLMIEGAEITETTVEETEHFRLYRDFIADPESFLEGQVSRPAD